MIAAVARKMLSGPRITRKKTLLRTIDTNLDTWDTNQNAESRLREAHADFKRTEVGFYDCTRALREYRDESLWEEEYDSFLAFIRVYLKRSKQRVYRAFARLATYEKLSTSERTALSLHGAPGANQLRALAKMPQEEWAAVIGRAEADGDVSGPALARAAQEPEGDDDPDDVAEEAPHLVRLKRIASCLAQLADDLAFFEAAGALAGLGPVAEKAIDTLAGIVAQCKLPEVASV